VRIEQPDGVGQFSATQTEPDHPWALFAKTSFETTEPDKRPAIIPSTGGGVPNHIFQDTLGLPTLWVPHSYAGCSQHAPDEHVLMSVMTSACGLMAGLYWDIGEGHVPR
jgi:hypothetical protein